jgi:hypothetical protein
MFAQDDGRAVVRTIGIYDQDGSVLYSAYVATKNAKIGTVAVGSTVPLGARFIEAVDAPAGAVFEGVRDNVAVWSLTEITEDRVVGPFTFRVKADGAAPLIAEQPAAVSFQTPEAAIVSYNGTDRPLVRLEDSGSVTFDQRGTIDASGKNGPVPVGRTGILLFIKEGVVRSQSTITFERRRVVNADLPADAEDTWWCAQYQIKLTPQENATDLAGVSFVIPTRRALPAGLRTSVFSHVDGAEWKKLASATPQRGLGFGGNNPFGGCTTFSFGQAICGGASLCIGANCGPGGSLGFSFGVSNTQRLAGSVTGSQITTATGTPTSAVNSITDGTSNTIIAILIGFRP